MKRLGIFVFYDKDGIVDGYVTYLLSQMKAVLDRLVIVSNVHLEGKEQRLLLNFTKDFFERENKGFDAGAYKDALCIFLGWDEVRKFDELVLFNDTFYGFFYPPEHVFNRMIGKVCDFWGISLHYENSQASIPEHLQSYFLVIRSKMLHNIEFERWWFRLGYYCDFSQVVKNFEFSFTQFFSGLGYSYLPYLDTGDWKQEAGQSGFNFQSYRNYRLLYEKKCPVLKKKNLAVVSQDFYNDSAKALQYVEENSDYDVNLIWQNLLRLNNISLLHKSFHFNLSVSDFPSAQKHALKIALLLFINDIDNFSLLPQYLNTDIDRIYIFMDASCSSIQEKIKLKNINVIYLKNEENPFSFVKDGFDYYFFLTDEINNVIDPLISDKILFSRFDAFLKNKNYMNNLLAYMEYTNRIGLVMPEDLENYFFSKNQAWKKKLPEVKNLLCNLKLTAPISREIKPFLYGKCFCAKKKAIKQLFCFTSWSSEFQKNTLPFALIYIAQANGYISYKIAQPFLEDSYLVQPTESGILASTHYVQRMLASYALGKLQFLAQMQKIFIYGCGIVAKSRAELLDILGIEYSAFVVSDGEQKADFFMNHPVLYLSEAKREKDACFILCVGKKNRESVIENLKTNGIKEFFEI